MSFECSGCGSGERIKGGGGGEFVGNGLRRRGWGSAKGFKVQVLERMTDPGRVGWCRVYGVGFMNKS